VLLNTNMDMLGLLTNCLVGQPAKRMGLAVAKRTVGLIRRVLF
jgi:hypothetical protein